MDRQLLWIIRNGAFAIALYFALVEHVGWLMYAVGGFVWWLCATAAWTMSDPSSPSSAATTDAPLATRTAFDAAVLVALHDIERIRAFDRVLLVRSGQIRADLPPEEMIGAPALQDALRIERGSRGWQVRRSAGPQSSQ